MVQSVLFSYPNLLYCSFEPSIAFMLHESCWRSMNAKVDSLLFCFQWRVPQFALKYHCNPLPPSLWGADLVCAAVRQGETIFCALCDHDHIPVSWGCMRVQYPLLMALWGGDRHFATPPPFGGGVARYGGGCLRAGHAPGIFFFYHSPRLPVFAPPPQTICPQESRGGVATSHLVPSIGDQKQAGVVWPSHPHVLCREHLRSSAVYLGDFPR